MVKAYKIYKFARKQLVMAGVVEPNEEEQQELAQAQAMAGQKEPSAQDQWALAEAQKSMAIAEKQKADTMKTLAQVDDTRADTATKLFELEQGMAQQSQTMQAMLSILQGMAQGQAQQNEQIKTEVNGNGEQVPPELLAQMQQQIGNQVPQT